MPFCVRTVSVAHQRCVEEALTGYTFVEAVPGNWNGASSLDSRGLVGNQRDAGP